MRSKVLQIRWHTGSNSNGNNEPVFSLDFHPSGMLATTGQDKEIMVHTFPHCHCVHCCARGCIAPAATQAYRICSTRS